MARPARDRLARSTVDAPLSPTEEADVTFTEHGKAVPVVVKHGGRLNDRKVDQAVFDGAKLTKSAALGKLFRQAVALRLADWSIPDIAKELGLAPGVVTRLFTEYRQKVDQEEIAQRLDQTAIPLAVDNLVHGLLAGDKDYTLETLKGRGFFKRHSDGGDSGPAQKELPTLKIEFVSPAGAARVEIGSAGDVNPALGKVVGAMAIPADLDGTPEIRSLDPVLGAGVPLAPDDPTPTR
jgi:hypothetical protein